MKLFMGLRNAIIIQVLAAGLILLGIHLAYGNPFLVCDAPTGDGIVEWYELQGLAWLTDQYTPEGDGSLKVDMVGTPIGTQYTVTAIACNVWGCSEPSDPFTFTRSDGILKPGTLGLVP